MPLPPANAPPSVHSAPMAEPTDSSGLGRDYWLLWGGSAVSNLGDGVRLTALPLLAAVFTRNPVAIGGVTATTFGPWVLFSLFGGAIVDRVDRRLLITWGQVARGVAVGGFAWMVSTGAGSLIGLYVVAGLIGVGEVVVDSATQAVIPLLAPAGALESANSRLIAAEMITNAVVGGPVGSLLFALTMAAPFWFDSASFLLGAVLIAAIERPLQTSGRPTSTITADISEGVRYLWRHSVLRGLALTVGALNLVGAATGSLLVLLALEHLGLSAAGFGVLIGTGAVGGVVGSLSAQRLVNRFGRGTILVAGCAFMAPGLLITGLASTPLIAGVGVVVSGAAVAVFNVTGRSLRQALVPDRLLGRVVASFRLVGYSAIPAGSLLGGLVARWTSVPTIYVLAAIGTGVSAMFAARVVAASRLRLYLPETG